MSHEKRKACITKLTNFKDFTIISVVFQKEALQAPITHKYLLLLLYRIKLNAENLGICKKRLRLGKR